MKKISLLPLALIAGLTFTSCSNNRTNNEDSVEQAKDVNDQKDDNSTMAVEESDSKFAVDAASGSMMEIEAGNLAQQKAMSPRVKAFGAMMVRDHTKASDELKTLAASKNITLPTAIGDDHMKHMNDLREKSGRDFDEAYMDMMVNDHKDDIDMFEKCANDGKDGDMKGWASRTLPTLRMHLDSAQAINDVVKKR